MTPNEPSTIVLDIVASVTAGIPVYYTVPASAEQNASLIPMTAPVSLLDGLGGLRGAVQPALDAMKPERVGQPAFASLRVVLAGFGTRSRRSAKQLR
ncbi:hypothetical protein [Rhodopseudomonas telluris]|uniref:Uncharacterized protein n=1 Tax=Rhodopseudomonas telluris TaxID=644215 RepID=A0ABV6ENP8_9BRAD